jgi:tetratricopeptide (TPR) repeat protein
MARWAGEMEFDFEEGAGSSGAFVATAKAINVVRTHLARGEVENAVRLYEQLGTEAAAELLREAETASMASRKAMAEMFVLARDFGSAGRVYELARAWADAGRLYEQAGDFVSAARCFQKEGDLTRAGAAMERAGQGAAALDLYEKAGAHTARAECMARQQRFYDAATLYRHMGNVYGEAEMLRLVPVADPYRLPAVKRLATLLDQYGHAQDALQLLADLMRQVPAAQQDLEVATHLIRLLEATGRMDQAARLRVAFKVLPPPEGANAPVLPPHVPSPSPVVVPPVPPPATGLPGVASSSSADPFSVLKDPFAPDVKPAEGGATPTPPPPDAYGFLKGIPIFAELAIHDMKELHRLCQEFHANAGSVLIEQGVKGQGLVIIVEGSVQILRVDAGDKTTLLALVGPGQYVGELALLDDSPTSARVMAQSRIRGLFLPRDRFEQFMRSRQSAAVCIYRLFTRVLAARLRAANQRR